MITAVSEAIMQQYEGDISLKNALFMYYEQAPEELTGNYCVFYILGGSNDEIMGGADDNIRNLDVQFNIFSDAADGGDTIAMLKTFLSACYDWVTLKTNGFGCIKMQPVSWSVIPVVDNIRQITVNYEVGIQKQ